MRALMYMILLPIFLSMEIKPKICKTCIHYISDNGTGEYSKCALFAQPNDNTAFLVNGICKPDVITYDYCTTARSFSHLCGKEAKFHKRKYVKRPKL